MTEQLLLPSFSIRGYRGFEALDIERLGRVNLLVGRNAVGKTSVLEAIELWAGDLATVSPRLSQILFERQEIELVSRTARPAGGVNWLRAFNKATNWEGRRIELGPMQSPAQSLYLHQAFEQWPFDEDEAGRRQGSAIVDAPEGEAERRPVLRFGRGTTAIAHRLSDLPILQAIEDRPPCDRLHARGMADDQLPKLWDRAIVMGSDGPILAAMRFIVPGVERLMFIEVSNASGAMASSGKIPRLPMVKHAGRHVEPLRAFGDGAVRVLELTLSLVNVEAGILLVDEIENGVHYSVLPDLWRLVFAVAAQLGVQVFAATHSWDCIKAFQKAATEHPSEGMLIRLERDAHGSRAKVFDEDDLMTVTRAEIDVR